MLAAIAVFWCLPACFAQEPEAAAPDLPASLLVKDRFARAVRNQSNETYYIMVTVVNDTTGESKRVCIDNQALLGAEFLQNHWGPGRAGSLVDWDKIMRAVVDNPTRTYHFTNAKAWEIVQPGYSPQMLARAQE